MFLSDSSETPERIIIGKKWIEINTLKEKERADRLNIQITSEKE